MNILITAGPTIEDIDAVRFLSNRASGTLGFAIARAAEKARHAVTLIHGPVALDVWKSAPKNATVVAVRSACQMLDAVFAHVANADVVIMNAAVADFTVAKMSSTKLKKSDGLELKLKPTVDILKKLGAYKSRHGTPILIGFALETGSGKTADLRRRSAFKSALEKLETKNLDAIVLNSPKTIGAADGDFLWIPREGPVESMLVDKETLARKLIRMVVQMARAKSQIANDK